MILDLPLFSFQKSKVLVKNVLKYLWAACRSVVFLISIPFTFGIGGNDFSSYIFTEMLFLLLICGSSFSSRHAIFSRAMIPCFIPGILFCSVMYRSVVSSDMIFSMVVILLVSLSQWASRFEASNTQFSSHILLRKLAFFSLLHVFYAVNVLFWAPNLLNSFVVSYYPTALQYDETKVYPTSTGLQFFYDDIEIADRIEQSLPAVISSLKTSPLFQRIDSMILVQKNRDLIEQIYRDVESDFLPAGSHLPFNHVNYYFTNKIPSIQQISQYDSLNDMDRTVITHELTHQMLDHYYGKWTTCFFIDLWKNEGYAEYMAQQGKYQNRAELLDLLKFYEVSDAVLQKPFPSSSQKMGSPINYQDYVAAMIQTRYALDEKKIPLLDFFKSTYQLASAQEIKQWLMSENTSDA